MKSGWDLLAQPIETLQNSVVAVVNDEAITMLEVRRQTQPEEDDLQEQVRLGKITNDERKARILQRRKTVLDSLIETRLILQDYKSKGYNFPDYLFDREERQKIREMFGGDRQKLVQTLEESGRTYADWRKNMREAFIVQQMRLINAKRFITVSPHMIEAYYQEHIRDFLQPDRVRLRMIYIGPDSGPNPEATAQEVLGMAEQGMDFASLAQKYSEYNRNEGGLYLDKEDQRKEAFNSSLQALFTKAAESKSVVTDEDKEKLKKEVERRIPSTGWVQREALNAELAEAAFALRPGQSSGIINLQGGNGQKRFYILHVEDVKKATITPLASIRDAIESTLVAKENEKVQREWIERLKRGAYIERSFF